MKSLFAALLLLTSLKAAASQPEFCKLGTAIEDAENLFFHVTTVDVLELETISDFQLSLVNDYIVSYGYLKKATSLPQIQKFFKTKQSYNDLYLKLYTSKATGEQFIEVVSYPGDNAVGTVYDSKTGAVLGHDGDGDYSHLVNAKEQYCSYEE